MKKKFWQQSKKRSRWINKICLFFLASFVVFLGGPGFLTTAQSADESQSSAVNENYRIGVGDVLRITVIKQPMLSVDSIRVANDGTITLPMLEQSLPAACSTEFELTTLIAQRYKKYLLNPQVTVSVREFNAHAVAVVGAVNTPGRFQLQRPLRLLEVLTLVNGPSVNAGKNVQVIRLPNVDHCGEKPLANADAAKSAVADKQPEQEVISLSLRALMKGDEASNLLVQAGDIVRVTEAQVEQAFVIGSVKAAATINLKEPVTLTKALAMAGGPAPGANIEKIKISREQSGGLAKTELTINLKDINKHNYADVLLEPNDIVDVPGANGTRKFIKDIFRATIPVITRAPIIIP